MFKIHTVSGSVYTFDPDNKKVIRENDAVALVMETRKDVPDVTGTWRTYTDFEISPSFWSPGDDILIIRFPEGDYVRSTAVARVENLTPVG